MVQSDAHTQARFYIVYQRRKKKAPIQNSLWLDDVDWSLYRVFKEDPLLDHHISSDQRLDLVRSCP